MKKIITAIGSVLFAVFLTACSDDDSAGSGNSGDQVAFDITRLTPTSHFYGTAAYTENARGIQLIGDTLLTVFSRDNNQAINFRMQTAGDITSAVYHSHFSADEFLGSTEQTANGHGIYLRTTDLRKMWIFNRTEVWEFDLADPGDLSSAAYSGYLDVAGEVERGHGIYFNPDGTRLYIDDRGGATVHQYDLAAPWSISETVSHISLDISARHDAVRAVVFDPDGSRMFLLDTERRELQAYGLSVAWDLSSAVYRNEYSLYLSNPRGFCWSRDGKRAYVMNTDNGRVFEYAVGE